MRDFHTWLAEVIATKAHEGQVDKAGMPYIDHPRAVAWTMAGRYPVMIGYGDVGVQAAWLHDVVEDTDVTLNDLYSAGFSFIVVEAVDSVTKRPGETYMDMINRAAAHPLGRLVKMADNRHNFGRLDHLEPDDRAFLHKRYTRAYAVLEAADKRARKEGRL